jgi:hypothetical protein
MRTRRLLAPFLSAALLALALPSAAAEVESEFLDPLPIASDATSCGSSSVPFDLDLPEADQRVERACSCPPQSTCICPSASGTPKYATGWGCGSTCAAATTACGTNIYINADQACLRGVCWLGETTYSQPDCIYNHSTCPGLYLRDCQAQYRCYGCHFYP